jgi:CO dehydrogenase maturation factor
MPKLIISGRGGSGKSTLVTLLVRRFKEQGEEVLVVDSDESNMGLAAMLGMKKPEKTLMDHLGGKPVVMERLMIMIRDGKGEGVELFTKNEGLDDLSPEFVSWNGSGAFMQIGKIEHTSEGCACLMGAIARDFLISLILDDKQWVLVDTEAGVEHFGRGLMDGADAVIMVVDPSNDAVLLTEKASKLTREANKNFGAVLNKVDEDTKPVLEETLSLNGITVKGILPYSPVIAQENLQGQSLGVNTVKNEIDELVAEIKQYN